MKLNLRTTPRIAELTFTSGNAKITEDLANHNGEVDESEIEELLTVANELHRFNGNSDISFVKKVIEAFLNDSEKAELLNTPNQLAEQNKLLIQFLSDTTDEDVDRNWLVERATELLKAIAK